MRTPPPGSTVPRHRVEDHQELPHAGGYQSNLLGLAGGHQSLVELLYGGVVAGGDQGSHVERFPHPRSAAPDTTAAAPEGARRVSIDRSNAYQSREFPRRKRAEFGQLRQERSTAEYRTEYRTEYRHATKQRLVLFEGGALFDGLPEVPICPGEFFFQPPYVGFETRANLPRGASAEAVFLGAHHLDELPSSGQDRLKLHRFGLGRSLRLWPEGLGETGEDQSVDLVGFGKPTDGLGEVVAGLAGIDHRRGEPGGGQRRHQRTLEAAGGLKKDHQDRIRFEELLDERLDAVLVVGNGEGLSARQEGHVQASLANVDADDMDFLGSVQGASPFFHRLRGPALRVRARREDLRPRQLFGLHREVVEGRDDPRLSCGLHLKWDQGENGLSRPYQPIVDKNQNTRRR
jgi:hypothetical protein